MLRDRGQDLPNWRQAGVRARDLVIVLIERLLRDLRLPTPIRPLKPRPRSYAALPPGGALIVYDAVIDDERHQNAFGLLMSLNMLIETPGGFDYTGADCQHWMLEAGFRETRVEHLVGPDSMVIGIK